MSIRAFTWDDLAAYARLMTASGKPATVEDAEEYLRQPNLSPERDCFLAEDQGAAAGFSLVVPEPTINRSIIEGAVHPDRRGLGIGLSLLEHAVEHSRGLGLELAHVSATPDQHDVIALYGSAGFAEVQRQWQMRLELKDLAQKETPSDYEIRRLKEGEEPLLTELQNTAFTGSWGFGPNAPEEVAYRLHMRGSQVSDALILWAGGKPLAYCWTKVEPVEGGQVGIIWMIGALPETRGRGFGRAMLQESVRDLVQRGAEAVELTVYADNTPAVKLYESAGFHRKFDILWFERTL